MFGIRLSSTGFVPLRTQILEAVACLRLTGAQSPSSPSMKTPAVTMDLTLTATTMKLMKRQQAMFAPGVQSKAKSSMRSS
jgi:hypothetical protein